MKRAIYIHERKNWPQFTWDQEAILPALSNLRYKQGHLNGYMLALGFALRKETTLQTLTLDILKSHKIEGELLDRKQVRSSVARKLGMDIAGLVPSYRNVEGVVEMMLDATRNYNKPLNKNRLFTWHASMFPTGQSGMHKITVGGWRNNKKDPKQVVSGAIGKERVHFEAPEADRLNKEMTLFFSWFNNNTTTDPVIKSALAHLWFLTVHPFDEGNGRMARAIAGLQLARSDGDNQRFYSMSAQISLERKTYYEILEKTQKGSLDVSEWLLWYLDCLDRALNATNKSLKNVVNKTRFWDHHHKTSINERQRLMVNKIFDGFTGNLTTSKWAKINNCSNDTALRDLQDLVEKKILKKDVAGGRSTHYTLKT